MPPGTRMIAALASQAQIIDAQTRLYGPALAREAEGRAPRQQSCRTWHGAVLKRFALGLGLLASALILIAPGLLILGVFGIAIGTFVKPGWGTVLGAAFGDITGILILEQQHYNRDSS